MGRGVCFGGLLSDFNVGGNKRVNGGPWAKLVRGGLVNVKEGRPGRRIASLVFCFSFQRSFAH